MKIGEALELVEAGRAVRRAAWPELTWVRLVPASSAIVGGRPVFTDPFLQINRGTPFGSPWHATSPDLLAGDWEEVTS